MKRKFNKNQKHITLRDIQLSSLTSLVIRKASCQKASFLKNSILKNELSMFGISSRVLHPRGRGDSNGEPHIHVIKKLKGAIVNYKTTKFD